MFFWKDLLLSVVFFWDYYCYYRFLYFIYTYEGRRGSRNLWDDDTFVILPCVLCVLACPRLNESHTGRARQLLTSVDLCCWRKREFLHFLNFQSPEPWVQRETWSCFLYHSPISCSVKQISVPLWDKIQREWSNPPRLEDFALWEQRKKFPKYAVPCL